LFPFLSPFTRVVLAQTEKPDDLGKSKPVPMGGPRKNIWHVAVMIRDMKKK
jgi:hypothetical protein